MQSGKAHFAAARSFRSFKQRDNATRFLWEKAPPVPPEGPGAMPTATLAE